MKIVGFIIATILFFIFTSMQAFAAPGDLDTNFSTDGYDILDVSATTSDDLARAKRAISCGTFSWNRIRRD